MFQKINRYFNRLKRESVNSINRNDPKLTDSKLTETTFWHVSKIRPKSIFGKKGKKSIFGRFLAEF